MQMFCEQANKRTMLPPANEDAGSGTRVE